MLRILERIYVVFSLLYFTGGLIPTDVSEHQQVFQINHAAALVQVIVFPVLAVFMLIHWKQMSRGIRASGWIMALCGLVVVSALWAYDPMFTLRRAAIFVATTMFATYLGSCFDWDEQLTMFAWTLAIVVIGSYLCVVLFPQYGISHDTHWGSLEGSVR